MDIQQQKRYELLYQHHLNNLQNLTGTYTLASQNQATKTRTLLIIEPTTPRPVG